MRVDVYRAGSRLLVRYPGGERLVGHPATLGLVLRDAFLRFEREQPEAARTIPPLAGEEDIQFLTCAECNVRFARPFATGKPPMRCGDCRAGRGVAGQVRRCRNQSCGGEFTSSRNQVYCQKTCRPSGPKTHNPAPCRTQRVCDAPWCAETFTPKPVGKAQRFCRDKACVSRRNAVYNERAAAKRAAA